MSSGERSIGFPVLLLLLSLLLHMFLAYVVFRLLCVFVLQIRQILWLFLKFVNQGFSFSWAVTSDAIDEHSGSTMSAVIIVAHFLSAVAVVIISTPLHACAALEHLN